MDDVIEHVIHDRCAALDRWRDHVAGHGLGDVGGLVAKGSAMSGIGTPLWQLDRDGGVPFLVGVPKWPIPARLVILLNRPVEHVFGTGGRLRRRTGDLLSCQSSPAASRSVS
ncbi:MAG TPA: hypothetical protein VFO27_06060 [Bryobacteraceae bacterium]|nr:hypothetical protein [Bryobacteraceae bacterium]